MKQPRKHTYITMTKTKAALSIRIRRNSRVVFEGYCDVRDGDAIIKAINRQLHGLREKYATATVVN